MAVLLVACGLVHGCGGESEAPATSTPAVDTPSAGGGTVGRVPPASFAALPEGWRRFDDGGAELTERGASSVTYATSWDFDPAGGDGPAGDLPDDGAIVQVQLLRRRGGGRRAAPLCRTVPASRAYPRIARLPLTLADMERGRLEGAPDVAEYRYRGAKGTDYRVEVRVDVAPDADRARAQEALDGLRLPRWGDRC